LAFASRRGNEATPLLLAAARRLETLDVQLARETYLDAFIAALFGGRLNDRVGLRDVARAARAALGHHDDQATAANLLLAAFVALAEDDHAAAPLCRAAFRKLSVGDIAREERLRWVWLGAVIALEVWDDESAFVLSDWNVQIARDSGALSELELALNTRSDVLVLCGELSSAASLVAESRSVQEATGISAAPYGAVMLTAWAGRVDDARELIEVVMGEAGSRGEGVGVGICEYARAVLCNRSGNYEEARQAAHAATEFQELVVENWGLPELIEAAARTGRTDVAASALERLATKARANGTDWALGLEARSRALLSEGDIADELFAEAIARLSRTRARPDLARAHLLYGEWLRRQGRRSDARHELNTAHDMFAVLSLAGFAERVQRELLATGATARKRNVETRNDLTAQETEIALLARAGMSNAEIAARLFVSPRTVEWHLSNVFTKLGISRRGQLGTALQDDRRRAPTG
jgi:DNA-binding CsgD family transcriptional regulator